jgi:hypothetical protein
MNIMKQSDHDIKRLHRLIERYFDATATSVEEAELRRRLTDTSLTSPEIEEARAVMGFFVAGRSRKKASRRYHLPAGWQRAAAAVAIAAVCGIAMLKMPGRDADMADRCVAYVGSTEVTDNRMVLAMMRSELNDLGEASAEVHNDIGGQLSIFANELSL